MPTDDEQEARVEARLAEWIQRRLADASYEPLDEFAPDDPDADELRLRWLALRRLDAPHLATVFGGDVSLSGVASAAVQGLERPAGEPLRTYADRYDCYARVARGGMGEVFRAYDRRLGRYVAVKVLRLSEGESAHQKQILAEARITAQTEHPSIVQVYDVGITEGNEVFYVMKLVEGGSLEAILQEALVGRRGRPTTRETLRWIRAVANALAAAHEQGILHRDLKPSNVMIGSFGEVYVLDWGIAKALQRWPSPTEPGDGRASVEQTLGIAGTPAWMAPEQADLETSDRDVRTDVFGLGALLYALLSGGAPYLERSVDDALERARTASRSAPMRVDWWRRAPRELRAVADMAMARDLEQRYRSVAALVNDLDAFEDRRSGAAWRDTWWVRARNSMARHPLAAAAALFIVVAGALGWAATERTMAASKLEAASERVAWLKMAKRTTDRVDREDQVTRQYAKLARTTLGALLEIGVDVSRPDQATDRLRALEAEDTEVFSAAMTLVHDLSFDLQLAGASLRMDPQGEPIFMDRLELQNRRSLRQILEETRASDPDLLDLWRPYSQLRSRLAPDEWARRLWRIEREQAEQVSAEQDTFLAELGWLFEESDARADFEVAGLALVTSAVPGNTFKLELRRLSIRRPRAVHLHIALAKRQISDLDWRAGRGDLTAGTEIRLLYDGLAAGRSALAATTAPHYALLKNLDIRSRLPMACYRFAQQQATAAKAVNDPQMAKALRADATGWRAAGFSARIRQVDVARAMIEQSPDEPASYINTVNALGNASYDLAYEVPADDDSFDALRSVAFDQGLDFLPIQAELKALATEIDTRFPDDDTAAAAVIDAYNNSGLKGSSNDRIQAALANWPRSQAIHRVSAFDAMNRYLYLGKREEHRMRAESSCRVLLELDAANVHAKTVAARFETAGAPLDLGD